MPPSCQITLLDSSLLRVASASLEAFAYLGSSAPGTRRLNVWTKSDEVMEYSTTADSRI